MVSVDFTEYARLELQAKLDCASSQAERNRLGQFATPPALATDILEYAKSLIPPRKKIRFLDPAIGTGAFLSALLRSFPTSRVAERIGYENDPIFGRESTALWRHTPLRLHIEDFTRAVPPQPENSKVNLIICNPPYVRHHHLIPDEKTRLQSLTAETTGISLSKLSGLYCYFLLLSDPWMADGCLAGWLMPSEFMDVNYGDEVKQYLLNQVTLLRIHLFDSNDLQFNEALVSSTVVWFKKAKPPADHSVQFTYGGSLNKPATTKQVSLDVLHSTSKWSPLLRTFETVEPNHNGLKLSQLFKIKRGLATGANNFFILTPEQVSTYQLPEEFLTPILASPRFVSSDEILADDDGNPLVDKPCFLLTCSLSEGEVQSNHPSLWQYLLRGIEAGVHERYLCSHRSPWYSQEDRPPSPLLCTYMGRQNGTTKAPFRFILNHAKVTAPNVYLMLYPTLMLEERIKRRPELTREIWEALNQIPPETLISSGRVYGGGLHKMEPKELANVSFDCLDEIR